VNLGRGKPSWICAVSLADIPKELEIWLSTGSKSAMSRRLQELERTRVAVLSGNCRVALGLDAEGGRPYADHQAHASFDHTMWSRNPCLKQVRFHSLHALRLSWRSGLSTTSNGFHPDLRRPHD